MTQPRKPLATVIKMLVEEQLVTIQKKIYAWIDDQCPEITPEELQYFVQQDIEAYSKTLYQLLLKAEQCAAAKHMAKTMLKYWSPTNEDKGALLLETALMLGLQELAFNLLKVGATATAIGKYLSTALTLASENGYVIVLEELLAKGATAVIDHKDDRQYTALDRAVFEGHFLCAFTLLAKGAQVGSHTLGLFTQGTRKLCERNALFTRKDIALERAILKLRIQQQTSTAKANGKTFAGECNEATLEGIVPFEAHEQDMHLMTPLCDYFLNPTNERYKKILFTEKGKDAKFVNPVEVKATVFAPKPTAVQGTAQKAEVFVSFLR